MMIVAKGQTLPDGTYLWTCNKCGGSNNLDCDWCYGLNLPRIQEEMQKGARGQRYYALLKAFLSSEGKRMVDFARTLAEENGKLSPVAVGWVSLSFGLNFKATCEWLEETHVIRAGAYTHIMESRWRQPNGTTKRMRVTDILDAAQERYGQP